MTVLDLRVGTAELDGLGLQLLVLLADLALQHSVVDLEVSILLMGVVEILLQFQHLPLQSLLILVH